MKNDNFFPGKEDYNAVSQVLPSYLQLDDYAKLVFTRDVNDIILYLTGKEMDSNYTGGL